MGFNSPLAQRAKARLGEHWLKRREVVGSNPTIRPNVSIANVAQFGRAPVSLCRGFESRRAACVPHVAQLVEQKTTNRGSRVRFLSFAPSFKACVTQSGRVAAFHAVGHEFESRRTLQLFDPCKAGVWLRDSRHSSKCPLKNPDTKMSAPVKGWHY